MKPEDLLGVGIRLGGVGLITAALADCIGVVLRATGLFANPAHTLYEVAISAGYYFVLGAVLLLGTNLIVKLAYRRR